MKLFYNCDRKFFYKKHELEAHLVFSILFFYSILLLLSIEIYYLKKPLNK